MPIIVNLDVEMAKKKISLNELSERVELNCQPGDILAWEEEEEETT